MIQFEDSLLFLMDPLLSSGNNDPLQLGQELGRPGIRSVDDFLGLDSASRGVN